MSDTSLEKRRTSSETSLLPLRRFGKTSSLPGDSVDRSLCSLLMVASTFDGSFSLDAASSDLDSVEVDDVELVTVVSSVTDDRGAASTLAGFCTTVAGCATAVVGGGETGVGGAFGC